VLYLRLDVCRGRNLNERKRTRCGVGHKKRQNNGQGYEDEFNEARHREKGEGVGLEVGLGGHLHRYDLNYIAIHSISQR
jgi:hypothetical protein